MTDAQPTADEHHDKQVRILRQVYDREHPTAQWSRAHAGQLFNIITDLRASLRREENARKVLAETNQRLTNEIREISALADHLRHCRTCAETDVAECAEGKPLFEKVYPF